jgi:hypothetical protein
MKLVMIEFHPQILKKNGKEEFVVLPCEEFVELQGLLADAEDLLELRQAKEEDSAEPSVSPSEVRRRFGLDV